MRTYLPAALLSAAIAWCTATGGAVDPPEMIVAATLVLAAFLTSRWPSQTRRTRSNRLGLALAFALIVWLIVDGPMRVGLDIEAVRIPFLVLLVVLAASTVSRLEGRQIAAVLLAAVAVGIVHAGLAVMGSVVQLPGSSIGGGTSSQPGGSIGRSGAPLGERCARASADRSEAASAAPCGAGRESVRPDGGRPDGGRPDVAGSWP